MDGLTPEQAQALAAAGASPEAVKAFGRALRALRPPVGPTRQTLAADSRKAQAVYRAGGALLRIWPPKPRRDATQAEAAETVEGVLRAARNAFAHAYADPIYDRLTDGRQRFLRVEELVYEVARLCPGL